MKRKHVNVIFSDTLKEVGKRDWGKEYTLMLIPGVLLLRRLELKQGKKGGLQYHHKLNECGYLISGKLIFRYDEGNGKLKEKILEPGTCFHIPPGAVHQEEALTDCVVIDASTTHFNDRVRVEKEYGLNSEGGLPSTTEDEVQFK